MKFQTLFISVDLDRIEDCIRIQMTIGQKIERTTNRLSCRPRLGFFLDFFTLHKRWEDLDSSACLMAVNENKAATRLPPRVVKIKN